MADFVEVDTDHLRTHAGYFDEVHQIALAAYNRLFDKLAMYGDAWGDDHFGHAFSHQYVPTADSQLKGMNGLAKVFGNISQAVRSTAHNYDAAQRAAQGE